MSTSSPLRRRTPPRILWGFLFPVAAYGMAPGEVCSAQQIRFEKLWEIGSIDGPEETAWMRISDATVLNGYVYAVDIGLPTLRRFTTGGEYVDDLGRVGEGPGEYSRPFALHVAQDNLWLYDIFLTRWVVRAAEGEHVRTARPPRPPGRFSRVWRVQGGWLVGVTDLVGASTPAASESRHHVIAWDSIGHTDTLATFAGNPFWTYRNWTEIPNMVTVHSLGADGDASLLGDSLLILVDGVGSRAIVHRATPSGFEEVRERALPGRRTPVSDPDREQAIAWYYRRTDVDPAESTIVRFVLPEWWSAWTAVRTDDQEGVWIRRGGPWRVDPAAGERWVRWSLDTDELEEVELPVGVEALQFRERYMVGLRRGELGIQYLVLYRTHGL